MFNVSPAFVYYLVVAIFIGQIIIVSFYLPLKWRNYRKQLFDSHPQADYPKLYCQPVAIEYRRLTIRAMLDRVVALFSIVIFATGMLLQHSSEQLAIMLFSALLIQLCPFLLSRYWGIKNSQLMQAMPAPAIRTTQLRARRLTDVVAPVWQVTALAAYLVSLFFTVERYVDIASAEHAIVSNQWALLAFMVVNTSTAFYLLGIIVKTLYGKTADQQLSYGDRLQLIGKKIRRLVYSSIFYSLFILALLLSSFYSLGIIGVSVLTSIFMQAILLLSVNPEISADYRVYQ